MNENELFHRWVKELTAALINKGLQADLDTKNVCGAVLGVLAVTQPSVQPSSYKIRLVRSEQVVKAIALNPQVKRSVRLSYSLENVVKIADYAKQQIDSWHANLTKERERLNRKMAGHKLAVEQEISQSDIPAWAIVAPNVEQAADAGTFRLTFRGYDVGYPLKRLTPTQVKRVIHFIKFIDKEPQPSCTCDCLPCQSCDHR